MSRKISPILNSTLFSSKTIGDGFIKYIKAHEEETDELRNAINFISTNQYLAYFGTVAIVELIKHQVSIYPSHDKVTLLLIKSLLNSPLKCNIFDQISLPADIINELPDTDKKEISKLNNSIIFFDNNNSSSFAALSDGNYTAPEIVENIASISDVFNENSKDFINNTQNFLQFVEQFEPFETSDISEFISNLVSQNNLSNNIINEKTILPLLRPFKLQPKVTVNQFFSSFDRDCIFIHSDSSFQLFINCLKDVANCKHITASPFLTNWSHPLTQLNFVSYLISNSSSLPIIFSNIRQIKRSSPLIIGDFKAEFWRSIELIDTLSYLYDFSETGVNSVLNNYISKGPTLLLLVMAEEKSPKVTKFATHLIRLLLNSKNQYMAGFATLWATNNKFFFDLFLALYEEQHSLICRFLDVVDDLNIFSEFTEKCPLKLKILLNIAAFHRRGFDFKDNFKKIYTNSGLEAFDALFNIFENPIEYGFQPLFHPEIKLAGTNKLSSLDSLFFDFIELIYKTSLNKPQQQKVSILFDKCKNRSPDLLKKAFSWHSPNQITEKAQITSSSNESDYVDLALSSDPKQIANFDIFINSLISEIPNNKQEAQSNGRALGLLLCKDLLCISTTTEALKFIDSNLQARENSTNFAFSIEALNELTKNIELYISFALYISNYPQVRKNAPSFIEAVQNAMNEVDQKDTEKNEVVVDYKTIEDLLVMPLTIQRFKYVRVPTERIFHDTIMRNKTNWDNYALYLMKSEMLASIELPIQLPSDFIKICVDASIYFLYYILNSSSTKKPLPKASLMRLGRWIGSNTLSKSIPVFTRQLDIPNLLINSYEKGLLCFVIPFLCELYKNVAPIFMPPCPWTVSILSILSSIARIPYLRNSIRLEIDTIFNHFKIDAQKIDPYPLHRLSLNSCLCNSDFLFPPIDFTSSLSITSEKKVFDCDITALFCEIGRHLTLTEQLESMRSDLTREIGIFLYQKINPISISSVATSLNLALKDFALCRDSEAVKRHSFVLLHQTINSLSMMSLSLFILHSDPLKRSAINMNAPWIDLLIRQIALNTGKKMLLSKLKPNLKLRKIEENFWDVKSFPPSISQRIPLQLRPKNYEAYNCTKKIDNLSVVAYGNMECFGVDCDMRQTYLRFGYNPLSIISPDIYPTELPINYQLASFIFSCFVHDAKTGEITSIKRTTQMPQFSAMQPTSIAATFVYCFPPFAPKVVCDFGIDLIHIAFRNVADKEQHQSFVHSLLWRLMPDLSIFTQFVILNLVSIPFFEVLAMNYLDSSEAYNVNLDPLVKLVYDLIQTKQISPNNIDRLLCFICNSSSNVSEASKLSVIRSTWLAFSKLEPSMTIHRRKFDASVIFLSDFDQLIENPNAMKGYFVANYKLLVEGAFWESLIITSFPDNRINLLKILYEGINVFSDQEKTTTMILQCFLRGMFNTTKNRSISMYYFSAVMANVILQLRTFSVNFAKIFGGFMNDTLPHLCPTFTGAWLYLFPFAAQPLLLADDMFAPTSRLVVYLLKVLQKFPNNWSSIDKYRKLYKSILRIVLLLIHDAPKFVSGYYFDFVAAVPLSFIRLRNIILCCRPLNFNNIILSSFIMKQNLQFNSIISASIQNTDILHETIMEWNKINNGAFSLYEVGKFLIYYFSVTAQSEFDLSFVNNHPLWNSIRYLIMCSGSLENAIIIIEFLFDQIRFDCWQTKFFTAVVVNLFVSLDVSWETISLKNIIFKILIKRSENISPVPNGIKLLKTQLENFECYQLLLTC